MSCQPSPSPPEGSRRRPSFRLEAPAHELVNDDPLTLDLGKPAYGAGTVDGSFAIKVRDTTVKQIAPMPDVAVKEAFGGAVAAAAGADSWTFLAVAVTAATCGGK